MTSGTYKAKEFAGRAGVTVRTLHHYDQLGLLKPARTQAGYRSYGDTDFIRLGQIVTLKFIGFPLTQIKALLDQSILDLPSALRLQRKILQEKRSQLDTAIEALNHAEQAVAKGKGTVPEALRKVTEAIEMTNNFDWTNKYYGVEAKHFLSKRRQENPGVAERGTRDWQLLIADVERAIREKVRPESKRGQKLAERWDALIRAFTQTNPAVEAGLRKLWADEKNWPSQIKKSYPNDVGTFLRRARHGRSC